MSEGKQVYTLSHIVFPDADFMEAGELFYRMSDVSARLEDGRIEACRRISLDTWMNLFAAKKWYTYCDLGNLYLKIQVKGRFRLQIIGHEYTVAFGVVNQTLLSRTFAFDRLEEVLVELPDVREFAGVSFRLDFSAGESYAMGEMCWCTDVPGKWENRIAIVTCTYRRERYVEKTIRKFLDFMEGDAGRKNEFHLFVVDNGKTLDIGMGADSVTILPNKNAGGAGGFSRGLMEANDRRFTHCLFMDDDVEIFPESFFRTLAVTRYFKEEYRDCSVNGPMMNLYDKTEMFENLAAYDGAMGFPVCRGHLSAAKVEDILGSIDFSPELFQEHYVHSAWWYTCCSLRRYREEYPVPVFFRGDDMEWSWRKHGMEIVSLNGICIWHAPFQWRVGRMADCYYLPRNMLLLAMLHQEGNEGKVLESLAARFRYLLDTLDYLGAEVFLTALGDIMEGHRTFREDPEAQMQRIRVLCGKAVIRKNVDYMELEQVRKRAWKPRDRDTGVSLDWYPPVKDFEKKNRVEVYNLSAATCETRVRDEERAGRLEREGRTVLELLGIRYEALREDMRKGYEIFKTRAFWDEYLGIRA